MSVVVYLLCCTCSKTFHLDMSAVTILRLLWPLHAKCTLQLMTRARPRRPAKLSATRVEASRN